MYYTGTSGSKGYAFSVGSSHIAYSADTTKDTWVHVAGVYDGTKAEIYINGVVLGSVNVSSVNYAGVTDIRIGNRGNNDPRHWKGKIDELRIYDTALSADEINSLYKDGR